MSGGLAKPTLAGRFCMAGHSGQAPRPCGVLRPFIDSRGREVIVLPVFGIKFHRPLNTKFVSKHGKV